MHSPESEFELAREELAFWRNFAAWWRTDNSNADEPRLHQALNSAERRCAKAEHLLRGTRTNG